MLNLRRRSMRWPVLALSAVAVAGGLAGTGWTLGATARQNAKPETKPVPKTARPAAKTPGKAASGDGKKERWVDLEMLDWLHDEQTGIDTGRDFTYRSEDMVVTGTKARWEDKKKFLQAEGSLVMEDTKNRITADKADVDDSKGKKLAILTGNVVIVVKPSKPEAATPNPAPAPGAKQGLQPAAVVPPPAEAAEKPEPEKQEREEASQTRKRGIVITCDRAENFYKRKFSILRGNLVFKQKITKKDGTTVERTLRAEHAEFDAKADRLLLFAPVEGRDTEGREISFEKEVIVGTKEGAETLKSEGKVRIKVPVEEEEEEAEGDKPPVTPR